MELMRRVTIRFANPTCEDNSKNKQELVEQYQKLNIKIMIRKGNNKMEVYIHNRIGTFDISKLHCTN